MLRGPAAFEKAGDAGAGGVVGRNAASPSSIVAIDSAVVNTGAMGASCAVGTSMPGFETTNFPFAAIAPEVENVEAVGTCLGVGAATFGFAGTNSVFNFSVFKSVFRNTGAVGVSRGVGSTAFGFGATNSRFEDASSAFATGR